VNYISKDEYKKRVDTALLFLKGEEAQVLDQLKKEMDEASACEHYERAAEIRDRVQAIEATQQRQSVIGHQQLQRGLDQDVLGLARDSITCVIVLLFVGFCWRRKA
jgi:excinuclease ABC subunit C